MCLAVFLSFQQTYTSYESGMRPGPRVGNLQAWHSTVSCRTYLTLCETLHFSDLSWLSYKLLFVRQDPGSITLSGKPSHGRCCHLEAWSVLRTDWQHSLPPLAVCLYSSVSPSITLTPCSVVCLDQTGPASLPDFQSILEPAPFTVFCQSVSLQNTHRWRERGAESIRDTNWEHSPFTCKPE